MSKKRTSAESSNDEQTNEGSDSVFQQDDNAKRAKRISFSDTTLQDLPLELFERILVKAIVMEVEGMKLARNVWKEKADLVIRRLSTVCPQWSNILTTNFFRNELHRTLDGIAQKTIRLEILHHSRLGFNIPKVVTVKDETFKLLEYPKGVFAVYVHDRNNLIDEKDVIRLPKIRPDCMAACSVSNCLYILYRKRCNYIRILRIARDDKNRFKIKPLITDVWMPNPKPTLSVAADGSLIFVRRQTDKLPVISIYNVDGSFQHRMRMHSDIPKFSDIIPKSNGNLVLFSDYYLMQAATLTEIDMGVTIIRQYKSSLTACRCANHVDNYGRILLSEEFNSIELLDSEFNLLDCAGPQLDEETFIVSQKLLYNSDRNEVVAVTNAYPQAGILTVFHFTEE